MEVDFHLVVSTDIKSLLPMIQNTFLGTQADRSTLCKATPKGAQSLGREGGKTKTNQELGLNYRMDPTRANHGKSHGTAALVSSGGTLSLIDPSLPLQKLTRGGATQHPHFRHIIRHRECKRLFITYIH